MSQIIDTDAGIVTAAETKITIKQVNSVLDLLYSAECTVPFITRYRKEKTGGLDEEDIRLIQETYELYLTREQRRAFIIESIKKQEQLTPELLKQISSATTLNQLEDLYAPYKSKQKSKGQLAIAAGLTELAELILTGKTTISDLEKLAQKFINPEKKVIDVNQAIEGAKSILIESAAHNSEIKEKLRQDYWKDAYLSSSKKKDADKIKDAPKFKDYFEYSEKVKDLKPAKTGHRYLAMRRGLVKKILKVEVTYPEEIALKLLYNHFEINAKTTSDILKLCAKKALNNYLHPSLDTEIKSELKKLADESAIEVFKINLKNLLLQPYLGAKSVMGLDPGIRTGVKVAIVDHTGKFLVDTVIYPFEPQKNVAGAVKALEQAIKQLNIKYIAIGNGTFGRETLQFIKDNITTVKEGKTQATLINEDGASIYSASAIAKEEFPDKDATVRGAISIARRFQDPLAELVKIDPKSIGVGQYQHDINQSKLKRSLTGVVENCVNFVGVDINTASVPLLSYISGVGPALAKNIVQEREKSGGIKTRQQLLKVPRFSPKIFEQSAGFLRIYNGEHPLDRTFIHPEQYAPLEAWAKKRGVKLNSVHGSDEVIEKLSSDQELQAQLGSYTHADIIKALQAPSQDPRSEFKSFQFRQDAKDMSSLKVGEWYPGQITNITQFGAFVDIGIKENGLLHVSQMSDKFVEDPLKVFKVGQEVKVKILETDNKRNRISLSCKSDAKVVRPARSSSTNKKTNHNPKNPFAALKNLKNLK